METTVQLKDDFQYQGITERLYTAEHPEIVRWAKFFTDRYKEAQIFEPITGIQHSDRRALLAVVSSLEWYRFSQFAPWFDCQSAAKVSDNKMRHYLIQIAFEELGMRDEKEIHCELFWETVKHLGISDDKKKLLQGLNGVSAALQYLATSLLAAKPDSEILGMMLGFEIPARENIETLLECMSNNNEALKKKLAATKFFKIHRIIETEHIRLSVSNWLRFCKTEGERSDFIKGCDIGLNFWKQFWTQVNDTVTLIEKEQHARPC